MKVICIDASPGTSTYQDGRIGIPSAHLALKEGEVYTAYQSPHFNDAYKIAEVPANPITGDPVSWKKYRFIPLSTIDEMELLEQRQTQYA